MKLNQIVPFKGINIPTVMKDGVVYVAVKPIVEAIGLEWARQQQKLMDNKQKFNCGHMYMVAQDGKRRRMTGMPLEKFPGWLFSINPEKVSSKARPILVSFQDESFDVLFSYWYFGESKNPRFSVEKIKAEKPDDLFMGFSHTWLRRERLKAELKQTNAAFNQYQEEFRRRGLSAEDSNHHKLGGQHVNG